MHQSFTSTIEQVASILNMSLAGKCYLSVFPEDIVYKLFLETVKSGNVRNHGKLFMSKTLKIKKTIPTSKWAEYYALLDKFGISRNRPSYFND